jgi:hypothetical protein
MTEQTRECCPRFNPEPWDQATVTWDEKKFVKDRVRSILHFPLNFGGVMVRCMKLIEAAEAKHDDMIVIADENSLWGADVYIDVHKDVPNAEMATISGTFLTKVFEGPYRNMRNWINEMHGYVNGQGKVVQKLYFYYTTCPRCAKQYGKNYVVLLARV